MIIVFRNLSVVLIVLFLTCSCNSQKQDYDTAVEYYKHYPNFLFTRFINEQLFGDLYLFNLKNKSSVKILSNVAKSSNPIFLNNSLDLAMFADNSPHRGQFYMINSKDMIYKKVSIEKKLDFVSNYNFIKSFDCYADGEIIFGFRNAIYIYSINSDKLNTLIMFDNICIREVAFDNNTKNISFSYHNGVDTLDQTFLGIYIQKNDSTILTNEVVISLGNFSDDGNTISFNSFYGKSGFYELSTNTTNYYSFMIDDLTLSSVHFLNNNDILLKSFSVEDLFHQDIYLYDLKGNRMKERLTKDKYGKKDVKVYK